MKKQAAIFGSLLLILIIAIPLFAGIDNPFLNIIRRPGASTRNVIQPTTAAVVPLTLKGATSQSGNLLNLTNSTGTVLNYFTAAGALGVAAGGDVTSVFGRTGAVVAATNDYTWAQINKAVSSLANLATRSYTNLSDGTSLLVNNAGNQFLQNDGATKIPLIVKGASAQSANLFAFRNSADTTLSYVSSTGTWNGRDHRVASVAVDGTVSNEDREWITSNCALASSVFTCTITGFTATPRCMVTITGTASAQASVAPASSTSVLVYTFDGPLGTAEDNPFDIVCFGTN